MRQGKQSPLVATDCGNRPTAEPLLAPGTAVQLWFTPVRRPQGAHAGKPHDGGGITLLIPPSPSDHRSAQSQPLSSLCIIPDYASLNSMKWLCTVVGAPFSTSGGHSDEA